MEIFYSTGMTISMLILAVYSSSFSEHLPLHSWVSTICLLAYIVTSTFGFLTIPFTMLPELFPQRVRGLTAGLTVCVAYFMSFLAIKSYPTLLQLIGNATVFLLYGIVSLLGTLFVYFVLPETKGKSLQEIENLFKRRPSASVEKA
jgi:sugar phosphate permease